MNYQNLNPITPMMAWNAWNTWNPWNPVAKKKVEPYIESLILKLELTYSNA